MGVLDDLIARLWDQPRTLVEKQNLLVEEVQRNTLMSGPGVFQTRTPFGTMISYRGESGSSFSSTFFRVSLTRRPGLTEVRFERGFIGGVQPSINGAAISPAEKGKKAPALIVKDADFGAEDGVCGVYFKITVSNDFAITAVSPVASATKPLKAPWTAFKLAGFLIRSGQAVRYDRQLYANVGFYAANRKANGFFDALFFWQP